MRPRLVEDKEEPLAFRRRPRVLEQQAHVFRFWGSEEDEVECLNHRGCESQIGLVGEEGGKLHKAPLGTQQHAKPPQHHGAPALQELHSLGRLEAGHQPCHVLLEVQLAAHSKGGLHADALQHHPVAGSHHHLQQRRQQLVHLQEDLCLVDVKKEVYPPQSEKGGVLGTRFEAHRGHVEHVLHGDVPPTLGVLQCEDLLVYVIRQALGRLAAAADAVQQDLQDGVEVRQEL
mmetsp:Transcript_7453/g.21049  ORF Transcript_7453/g.21049 Transcript_7453/m.21049 type:complete len:231 (-) Transcript_7453:1196-1888(-)